MAASRVSRWRRSRLLIRLFAVLSIVPGAFAQGPQKTPGGMNFYSMDREIAMGAQLANAVRRDTTTLDNAAVQEFVARLGRQLSLHAPGPDLPYNFTVVDSLLVDTSSNRTHEPLAFPGGEIFVPASLILEVRDTPELAGMLAHAIAHAAARHCTRLLTREDLMRTGAIESALKNGCWIGEPVPLSYVTFYRSFEREADYMAVEIMANAGFNPAALATYLRRVQPADRASLSRTFATLPAVEERVSAIEKEMAQIPPGRNYSTGEDLQEIQREVRNLTAK